MNTKRIESALESLKHNRAVYMKAKVIVIALTTGRNEVAEKRLSEFFNLVVKLANKDIMFMDVYEEANEFYNAALPATMEAKA